MSFGKAEGRREKHIEKQSPQIATFYDWSPGLSIQPCQTVMPPTSLAVKGMPSKILPSVKSHRHVTGRMFHKDKSHPTKGEKCIMTGIMQNRGDLSNNPMLMEVMIDGEGIMSHKDAWRIKKDDELHLMQQLSQHRPPSSLSCTASSDDLDYDSVSVHNLNLDADNESTGTKAPPCSPETARRNNMKSIRSKVCSKHGGMHERFNRSGKTVVDVFLPRLSVTSASTCSNTDIQEQHCPRTVHNKRL